MVKKITIIGSGATGTLLAVNLITHNDGQSIEINLVEKKERIGRGVAYSTTQDVHLLNVPAAKMGAFPYDLEIIRNDRLNLGIDATADGKTIDGSGTVSEKIFTIGTALKGILWESTAMPEIRAQANKLAYPC